MKIKNILLLSLSLLVLASCSKDDDGTVVQKEPVDAVISVMATAVLQKTKAEGAVIGKEEFIQTLTAYVFDSKGVLAGSGTATSLGNNSVSEIEGILIKITPGSDGITSADSYKMVLLANTNVASMSIGSLDDLKKATGLGNAIGTYKVGTSYIPMVSDELTLSGIKKSERNASGNWTTNNWASKGGGAVKESSAEATEIPLTRMLARVEVSSVTVNLKDGLTGSGNVAYEGATFNLKTIALMNVRTNADYTLKGIGDYVKGYQSDGYKYFPDGADSGWWLPVDKDNNVAENGQTGSETCDVVKELSQEYDFGAAGAFNEEEEYVFGDPISNPAVKNPAFYRYAYPNSPKASGAKYETGLVVGGEFVFQGGKKATKHFIVILRDPKTGIREVLPNTVYQVAVYIQGEGSEDENHPQKTAEVSATITVKAWDPIKQEEDLGPITPSN